MRNPFFDVLKFFAILLVIYGHVGGAFGCAFGQPIVGNFIVGMNMPIFFIVSGYFAAKTIEKGDWKKLGRHCVGYFWPITTISIVFGIFAVVFNMPGSENGFVGYAGRNFLFSPWFLWCLSICFVLTFLCLRLKLLVFRGGAFFLLIIALPFVTRLWHMHEVRSMLPHFCFGAFLLRRWELWKNWKVGLLCLLIYLGVLFVPNGEVFHWRSFYGQDSTWVGFLQNGRLAGFYFARIANGIVGSVGVMWLLQELVGRFERLAYLAPLGRTTLGVYLLHQWLLARLVSSGWCGISVGIVLVWTLALFFVCHWIVTLTKRVPLGCKLFWGEWW